MIKEKDMQRQIKSYGKYYMGLKMRNDNYLIAIGPDFVYFIIGFVALNSIGMFMNI